MMIHKHLLIKAQVLDPPRSNEFIKEWLTKLVEKIDMVIAAGPISSYVETEGNLGLTSAVCIQTSHCSLHVWDEVDPPLIQADVYSCKEFDIKDALEHFEVFNIVKMEYILIDRMKNQIVKRGEVSNANRTKRQLDR